MQRGLTLTDKAALPVSAREPTTDEALIRRIAQGDKCAMQVLFARHNVRVYRFIARLLGDSAPAEDLVSEVFLDVWRKAHQFEGRSQVSTRLLGIARYKALTHLRRRTVNSTRRRRTQSKIPRTALTAFWNSHPHVLCAKTFG